MTVSRAAEPDRVLGGELAGRITPVGRFLRRHRLDELPQVFNVLGGDMTWIGPRPPLRVYVSDYPDLYGRVLSRKPGVTGLATVVVHRREARLLAQAGSATESDAIYRRACIPLKARLDVIYDRNRSWRLDAYILFATVAGVCPRLEGVLSRIRKVRRSQVHPPRRAQSSSYCQSGLDRLRFTVFRTPRPATRQPNPGGAGGRARRV